MDPSKAAVLPASHLRKPHESAFVLPQPVAAASTSPSPSPSNSGPSYSHRKRPTLARPFIAYDPQFLDILGPEPTLRIIARAHDGRSLYHEAGVWCPASRRVFATSNRLDEDVVIDGKSGAVKGYVQMHMVDPTHHEDAAAIVSTLAPTTSIPSANGACLWTDDRQVLVCDQGYGERQASQLVLLDPETGATRSILNNFHGRPFNSLNDVVTLTNDAGETTIWFTDPTYGHEQQFRPQPSLPPQVYCFHPRSGTIRVVADNFVKPNGIAFNRDGTKGYITDTGFVRGCGSTDGMRPGTVYEFDVAHPPAAAAANALPKLVNRSVFAFVDCGAPDGIKVDNRGNVYAGCFDGVHVWNEWGTLLGKM